MKIYTRTGDKGTTGLFGGGRVRKHHPRVDAYGTVDELNSALGVARADLSATPADGTGAALLTEIAGRIAQVQADLLTIGAEFASSREPRERLPDAAAARLETWIDEAEAHLPALTSFILPGGTRAAASLHVARTTCRRAERLSWAAADAIQQRLEAGETGREVGPPIAEPPLIYLNRLADLLFTWARLANHAAGVADVVWQAGAASGE
jgi:cob(I)alamin adenosyltransferase